jgi:hypothetical protein
LALLVAELGVAVDDVVCTITVAIITTAGASVILS